MPNPAAPAKKPQRAVSPRLRIVLFIVLGLFSLLAANGIYLSAITAYQQLRGVVIEDYFYQFMFLAHLVLGFIFTAPVIAFGFFHWKASRHRRNKRAIRIGYALMAIAVVVLVSGVLLTRIGGFEFTRGETSRRLAYWLHVICPLVAIWLYWLHRLVGPSIKWYIGRRIAIATAVVVGAMVIAQMQDPRDWNAQAPKDGAKYFQPSLATTRSGNFIPAAALQNDDYCKKCHNDIYNDWFHSAHHFSSFNNPAYLYAVRETRKKVAERDGSVQASRWCAGCHDPVPFFSGAFDDPKYDDVNHPTSQAGITCTVCHAISQVESVSGNADYVIEEPQHYPFTYSDSPVLQKVNELLVKAKPGFHKNEMLKPVHKTAEFCSTCHKVHLPGALTGYKDFLRGQNHYDSYLLSGVSGHGARSFYYPPKAQTNCNGCHMEFKESNDFGAQWVDGKSVVHDHFFAGGNTALPHWRGDDDIVKREQKILVGSARVDIFGVRAEGRVDGELSAPLGIDPTQRAAKGPEYGVAPVLAAGETYLIESVIRTLKLGHHLTQGTVDSNELWLDVLVTSGDRVVGASGQIDEEGRVDRWSHFVNNFVIDRHGDRIERRNAQDIFTAVYNHQIPPGAGQIAHYQLRVPEDIAHPIKVRVALRYRKFDQTYWEFMRDSFKPGDRPFKGSPADLGAASERNQLPITTIAEDTVVFPVRTAAGEVVRDEVVGGEAVSREADNDAGSPEEWQRWNDYGIALLLTGNAQLRQASEAFERVESMGRFDGPLNLARVLLAEGNLDAATDALRRAEAMDPPPPAWTFAWLSGELAVQQGQFELADKMYRSVLYDQNEARRSRGFDFSRDYLVRLALGNVLIDLSDKAAARGQRERSVELIQDARHEFEEVTKLEPENAAAFSALRDVYSRLSRFAENREAKEQMIALAEDAARKHQIYKLDDNAADVAIPVARAKYPAADHAAEKVVIYDLHREAGESDQAEASPEVAGL